jgi:hypothetical protein
MSLRFVKLAISAACATLGLAAVVLVGAEKIPASGRRPDTPSTRSVHQVSLQYGPKLALASRVPPTTVPGTVALLDYGASVGGRNVTFQIRQAGTTNVLETDVVALDSASRFTFIASVAPGVYDITAKGSHWLRQKKTRQSLLGGSVGPLHFELVNADVNGDNVVSLGDFADLRNALSSVPGDANWNAEADLNGDDVVSLADFAILR